MLYVHDIYVEYITGNVVLSRSFNHYVSIMFLDIFPSHSLVHFFTATFEWNWMNAQHLITISEVVCDEGYTDYMWNNKIVLHDTQLAHVFCPSFGWRNEADKRVAHLQLQGKLAFIGRGSRAGAAHWQVWDNNHDKCLPRNLPSVTKFTILYDKNKARMKGHKYRTV